MSEEEFNRWFEEVLGGRAPVYPFPANARAADTSHGGVNCAAADIAQRLYEPPAFFALPYWSTREAAEYLRRQPSTLRKAYAATGAFMGVVPHKVGCRLLWPAVVKIRALVEKEAP